MLFEPLIGKKPTRQSLNMNKDIVEAYQNRKKGIRATDNEVRKPANIEDCCCENCKS